MTVSIQSAESIFLGNGVTTTWSFPWQWESAGTIEVSFVSATGTRTVLAPTQYTLVLNPASVGELWGTGGTVTYPTMGSPIATGTQLVIRRTVPFSQPTEVANQTSYPVAVETAMDNLAFQIQQLATRSGQFRGTWATGIYYNFGDFVLDGANGSNTGDYYMCSIANTSTTWAADLAAGDWFLIIDITAGPINADNITMGVLSSSHGGAGAVSGILKANGAGVVSAAAAGADFQAPITLTTTGTSGVATFSGTTINVPNYSSNPGSGTVTSVTFTGDGTVLSATPSAAVTASGTVAATLANATAKSLLGNPTAGALAPVYTTTPVVSGTSTAASFTPTSASVPANGLYLAAANTPAMASNSLQVAYFVSSGTGADYLRFISQSAASGPVILSGSSGSNSPLNLSSLGISPVLIFGNGTGTLLASFANSGAATLNVAGATWTAGSFTPNSATVAGSAFYLPSANNPGIASNGVLVATFNTPGSGGDYLTFKNVTASGISSISAPTACTIALAGGGAGNLSAGAYSYKITYVSTVGETALGSVSNTISVVAPGSNGKMALSSIPLSGSGSVTARNIYRTVAGGATYYFLHQLADNTTITYTDNIADATLISNYSAPTSQSQIPVYTIVGVAAASGDTSVGIQYRAMGTTTGGHQFMGTTVPGGINGAYSADVTGQHQFFCNNQMAMQITDTYWNPSILYGGAANTWVVISSVCGTAGTDTFAVISSASTLYPGACTGSGLNLMAKGPGGQLHHWCNGMLTFTCSGVNNPQGDDQYTLSNSIAIVCAPTGTGDPAIFAATSGLPADSATGLKVSTAGTGNIDFTTDNFGSSLFRMQRAANAVNMLIAIPAATGSGPTLQAGYIDAAATLNLSSHGTASVVIKTNDSGTTVATFANGGDITASLGNLVMGVAGKGLVLKRGANGKCGTFILTGTTPVTVANTSIAITDVVDASLNTVGGTVGNRPSVKTVTAGAGFTVAGDAGDTSTYNYAVISNAA